MFRRFVSFGIFSLLFSLALLAQMDRGVQLYEQKKFKEAESVLRSVVREQPDNAEAHYRLGLTLLELGKFSEAEAAFEKAGDTGEAHVGMARACMGRKDLDTAAIHLAQASEKSPDSAEVHFQKGVLEAHRKNYDAAAKHLEKALELDPDNAQAHYYAGVAYNQIGRPDKMVDHFQMFLKLAPDAPEAARVRSLMRSVR